MTVLSVHDDVEILSYLVLGQFHLFLRPPMDNALVQQRRIAGLLDGLPKRDVARCRSAEQSAKELLHSGCALDHHAVLQVLRQWSFAANVRRTNIQHDGQVFVHSDTFGLVPRFAPKERRELIVGRMSQAYPCMTRMMATYVREVSGQLPSTCFTTLTLNAGIRGKGAAWHRDAHNVGPSRVTSLGEHTGGELLTRNSDGSVVKRSVHKSVILFDGRLDHSVRDFCGKDRFSIVVFCSDWNKQIAVKKRTLTQLAGMGMQIPDQSYATQWLAQLPQRSWGLPKQKWADQNWWSVDGARRERIRRELVFIGRAAAVKSVDARTLKCVVFHSGCRKGQAVAPPAKFSSMRGHLRADFGKVKALCKFCRAVWWKQYSVSAGALEHLVQLMFCGCKCVHLPF